jgi:hypothetical protein
LGTGLARVAGLACAEGRIGVSFGWWPSAGGCLGDGPSAVASSWGRTMSIVAHAATASPGARFITETP